LSNIQIDLVGNFNVNSGSTFNINQGALLQATSINLAGLSLNTQIDSLNNKTSVIPPQMTANTFNLNSVDITTIGDGNDIFNVRANTTFFNPVDFSNSNVSGLTKSMVGLGNVDNTADVNKPISNLTQTALNALSVSKADKSSTIYSNTYFLNSNVNRLSDILTAIGTSHSQTIEVSGGGHSEANTTTPIIINKINLCMYAPDSGFNSPASTFYYPITINGSNTTRIRISNISFNENVVIDGTQGRHNFKGCSFNKNFTITGTTTNWLIFMYCSFSGQVNVPNTYAGYIIFYFCDFQGSSLNWNNLSPNQIYVNSCNNLPSFTLNGLLNGFNTTTTSTGISTATLNVSNQISFPPNSVSISNINGLQTALDSKANDNQVVKLTNVNQQIAGIKNFTTKPQINNADIATETFVSQQIANLVNNSPQALDTLSELANALGNDPNFATTISTQIGLKANDNAVVHLSGSETITGEKTFQNNLIVGSAYDINLKGSNLNTRLTNDETAITNLQQKTNGITFNNSTNTMTINNKLVVAQDEFLNGNTTIGDASTDILTINATPTFNTDVSINSTKKLICSEITLNGNNLASILTFDSVPTLLSTKLVRSGGIFSYLTSYATLSNLNSYVLTSSLTSTLLNYITSSSLTSTLSNYITSSSLTSTLSNYITSSSLTSTLSNYLTSATASSTYQTISGMSSYLTTSSASSTYSSLSGNQTITGNKIYNNQNTFSRVLENITSGTITSNILTINFSSNNSVVYVSPSANYTINFTNIPSGTQTNSYTFTIWNTARFYGNVIQVGGTGQTILAIGGASNIASGINASATNLLQQITLIYVNASTPTRVLTSVASIF
jgi:hypothetical protein